MAIVMLGLPGAGKGTISKELEEKTGYEHVSVGELLREEINKGTHDGNQVDAFISKGLLAPDYLVNRILLKKLEDNPKVILDGYPRTEDQAKILAKINIPIELVVYLDVPEEILFQRLRRRREIENRPDDTDELIQFRIERDKKNLGSVLDFYGDKSYFASIDGSVGKEAVADNILDLLALK